MGCRPGEPVASAGWPGRRRGSQGTPGGRCRPPREHFRAEPQGQSCVTGLPTEGPGEQPRGVTELPAPRQARARLPLRPGTPRPHHLSGRRGPRSHSEGRCASPRPTCSLIWHMVRFWSLQEQATRMYLSQLPDPAGAASMQSFSVLRSSEICRGEREPRRVRDILCAGLHSLQLPNEGPAVWAQ